jgi:hypothetical protein
MLSATLTVADRVPGAVGENFTTIVQLALCANELPQVFVSEKSLGLAPARVMPDMLKLVLPVFARATLCVLLVVPTF